MSYDDDDDVNMEIANRIGQGQTMKIAKYAVSFLHRHRQIRGVALSQEQPEGRLPISMSCDQRAAMSTTTVPLVQLTNDEARKL